MWFTRISIGNPVLATMMMLVFVVLGIYSYKRLQVDQFPDINFPVVVVRTDYPGASPESVENDVTRKIEEAVNTLGGINSLTSRSFEGMSLVIVEFELTVDAIAIAQDVREKIAAIKSEFRKEIKEPKVTRYDPAEQPIFSLALIKDPKISKLNFRDLSDLAEEYIKKRLENAHGVGAVNLVGVARREIQIQVKPQAMESLGIGIDQLISAVRSENQDIPAGAISSLDNEKIVQIQGRIKNPDDFSKIVVARRAGHPILLSQVASIFDGQQEEESLALYNGQRTLALDVLKAEGQNTIEVVNSLKGLVSDINSNLSKRYPGLKLEIIKDNAKRIRIGVDNVGRSLLEGAILTILIVFVFLNSWRSTVITGLTLPVALLGTFFVMKVFGFTINSITLMALSLCVGLLIDDAIVVRENIVRHMGFRGADGILKNHRRAALDGTAEIGMAVLATTLSIVAVFLPIGFMGGMIGRFFHQFGITVAAAVLISMFVSFTLDPMLSSVWPDPAQKSAWYAKTIGRVLNHFEKLMDVISTYYQKLLKWSLDNRGLTILVAALAFGGGLGLPTFGFIGSEFVPQADFSETGVIFNTPVGSSLEFTEGKVQQVESILRSIPEIENIYSAINTANSGKNSVTIYITLKPRKERKISVRAISTPIRKRLNQIAGITVTHVGSLDAAAGDYKQLRLNIMGSDLKKLAQLSDEAIGKLKAIPNIVDLDSSMKAEKPLIVITPHRDLAGDLGVGVAQIGSTLRSLLAGEGAGVWRSPDDQNYNVNIRLPLVKRASVDDLSRLMLVSDQINLDGSPKLVSLRQVADISESAGIGQINRRNLNREVEISANVMGRSPGQVAADVRAALDSLNWPIGYQYEMGGQTKSMSESLDYASGALLLAIIFIYMILASQFASFLQPIAIMSSLPLTLIGVFLALLIFRSSMNIFSIIGFIMLMGLVTKNAILLIDFTLRVRKEGKSRVAALLEAAHVRFRPIVMTTLAMVFGMVPLAFSISEGSEQRGPLGQAVIGGVITSTLLTLVVVPVIYTYLDDLGIWWAKYRRYAGTSSENGL